MKTAIATDNPAKRVITEERLLELLESEAKLSALEAGGIDN